MSYGTYATRSGCVSSVGPDVEGSSEGLYLTADVFLVFLVTLYKLGRFVRATRHPYDRRRRFSPQTRSMHIVPVVHSSYPCPQALLNCLTNCWPTSRYPSKKLQPSFLARTCAAAAPMPRTGYACVHTHASSCRTRAPTLTQHDWCG